MKVSVVLSVIILTTISFLSYGGQRVKMLTSKSKDFLVFSIGKKMKGADFQLVTSTGEVITHQKLSKRKLTIDFKNIKKGVYTIRLVKDDYKQEFIYTKD